MRAGLHALGFKCSTNITPLPTDNALDENGNKTEYAQRKALADINGLIYDTRVNQVPQPLRRLQQAVPGAVRLRRHTYVDDNSGRHFRKE